MHDSKGVLSIGVGWRGRIPRSEAVVLLFKGNFQIIIGDGALVGIDSRSQVCWHLWCCSLYPSWAAAVLSADKVVQYTPPRPTSHTGSNRYLLLPDASAWHTAPSHGFVGMPCSSL